MEKHLVRAWLLQHPRVECDGKPLNIRLKKAQALLFYLLVQKKATREEAAGLLWGGEADSLAHRHLRDNLYQLKKVAPVELIRPVGSATQGRDLPAGRGRLSVPPTSGGLCGRLSPRLLRPGQL